MQLEWSPTKMVFSVDSIVHYTYEPADRTNFTWPFDNPQYLLLNIAIQSNIDANFTSSPMILDYIRVYQSSTLNQDELEYNSIAIYPSPANERITVEQPWRNASFIVYDVKGTNVLEKTLGAGQTDIDISTLSEGIYFCRIQIQQQAFLLKKKLSKITKQLYSTKKP